MDKIKRMAGVKDLPTHLHNNQARFIARCEGDLIPVRFANADVMADELTEQEKGESGWERVRFHLNANDIRLAGSSP